MTPPRPHLAPWGWYLYSAIPAGTTTALPRGAPWCTTPSAPGVPPNWWTCAVSRPIQAGNVVYIAGEREAYALHAGDGTKIWNFAADNGIHAMASAAGKVYLASNNLYALRASDGTRIWNFPVEADLSMMIVADGNIYLAASNGEVHALRG